MPLGLFLYLLIYEKSPKVNPASGRASGFVNIRKRGCDTSLYYFYAEIS